MTREDDPSVLLPSGRSQNRGQPLQKNSEAMFVEVRQYTRKQPPELMEKLIPHKTSRLMTTHPDNDMGKPTNMMGVSGLKHPHTVDDDIDVLSEVGLGPPTDTADVSALGHPSTLYDNTERLNLDTLEYLVDKKMEK